MAEKFTYQELQLRVQELERNEKILRAKTERLEFAIDAVEDGIWDFDPRTGRAYFSPRWLSMLGYEPGDLPSSYDTWINLLHPDDRSDAENTLKKFFESPGDLFSIEFRMRTKNGDWRWVHSRGKTIAVDDDGNISRIIGTHVDITERRRLENSLRLTQFIYEKASIGIFRVGSDARILEVNDEAAKSLGYSKEELSAMSIFDIDPLTKKENWGQIWQRLLDKGTDRFEVIHRHRDGTEIPVFISSNLIEYDGQQFSIAFAQDISQLKRMEQALFQAQKMEAIGTLAGGIAHDFNNILAAIYGFAQLAQLSEDDDRKVQEYIHHICVASKRAKELVKQILAFSRQDVSLKTPIDIGVTVKEALKLLRASIPATIDIEDKVALDLDTVEADQTQIHQIIMNLCTNSAHALRSAGGKIVVELLPFEIGPGSSSNYQNITPGKYLKLIVSDNGHGMDPEILKRIFDPYFTTKNFGEGTGMGLATVHGIVSDHGGAIKVYSEPGIGTAFHILFPVVNNPSIAVSESVNVLPRGTEQIMFVDDEQFLVDIGKKLLTSLGYNVDTTTNPLECLETFRTHPEKYDLIITDFSMPQMDGGQLIREIRNIRQSIPVILCTGFNTSILSTSISQIGIDSILSKPITTYEIANTVRQVLDARSGISSRDE